jgi:beta-lactamase class A
MSLLSLLFMMLLSPPLPSLIDSLPAHLKVSVIVERLDGDVLFEHGADDVVPSASVIKIPILATFLASELRGEVTVTAEQLVGGTGILQEHAADTTITWRRLAELMIAVSDNSATNAIIRGVGMEAVNADLASWGLTHTRLRRHMMDFEAQRRGFENTTTPREMNAILRRFAGNTEFIDILLMCEDQTTLPAGLPSGARFAHKTGTLTIVRGDAGILLGEEPLVISAFVRGFRSEAEAEAVLASIGAAIVFYRE